MMRRTGLLSAMLVVLAGCTSSDPHFRREILDVDDDLLGRYWIVRQSESTFDAPAAPPPHCTDGYVTLVYVIDSHGHVSQADVLQSEPEGCYEEAAITLVNTWTFVPARKNRRRTPVRVAQRILFSSE